jgi:hypothetical protein
MKPHQQLEVFLPKLREGLRRKGIAEVIIASYESTSGPAPSHGP